MPGHLSFERGGSHENPLEGCAQAKLFQEPGEASGEKQAKADVVPSEADDSSITSTSRIRGVLGEFCKACQVRTGTYWDRDARRSE